MFRERGQGSGPGRANRHKLEIEQMKTYFNEVAKLVTNRNTDLLTKADLDESFEKWQSNFEKKEITLSWRNKRPSFMCPPIKQEADDCWAIALSRAISILLKINGSDIAPPTHEQLCNDIDAQYLSRSSALDKLENAIPHVTQHYVRDMAIRHRPSLASYDQEKQEKYEKCIVRLLAKAPLAIAFESLPSFSSHDWKTIFVPTYEDSQARLCEILPDHCALLTGVGVEIRDGVATEFWEVQESGGETHGNGGYVRLARQHCLIREVCQLEA